MIEMKNASERLRHLEGSRIVRTRREAAKHFDGVNKRLTRVQATSPGTDRLPESARPRYEKEERLKIMRMVNLLGSEEFKQEVADGKVTFSMIKPNANDAIGVPDDDNRAAKALINAIGHDKVIWAFNFKFSREQAEEFYSNLKDDVTNGKISEDIRHKVLEFMTSGPVTALAVRYKDGNAPQNFRELIGPTNPQKARIEAPDSLRAIYADSIKNNHFHGSDSTKSALREFEAIRQIGLHFLKNTFNTTTVNVYEPVDTKERDRQITPRKIRSSNGTSLREGVIVRLKKSA